MKFWFDTEFIEDGRVIDLISIGIVSEDNRRYYRQNIQCDFAKAGDWVRQNVFPGLLDAEALNADLIYYELIGRFGRSNEPEKRHDTWWRFKGEIAREIVDFFGESPEIWAYYADYDWVALCQLYGKMIDLPKGWPMYCRDIKQLCDELGNPTLPAQKKGEHNALQDAIWNRKAWDFLRAFRPQPLVVSKTGKEG